MHRENSGSLDPRGLGQLGLALVEGPESFGFESEGAGDVQGVEGSHAEFRRETAGEISAKLEGIFRHRCGTPKVGGLVGDKFRISLLRLLRSNSSAELMLPESVGPFRTMQGSKRKGRCALHSTSGLGRMDVGQIQGDYEAGIDVNVNNVPGLQG